MIKGLGLLPPSHFSLSIWNKATTFHRPPAPAVRSHLSEQRFRPRTLLGLGRPPAQGAVLYHQSCGRKTRYTREIRYTLVWPVEGCLAICQPPSSTLLYEGTLRFPQFPTPPAKGRLRPLGIYTVIQLYTSQFFSNVYFEIRYHL